MRPQFSDASGKISLPESAFDPLPDGWIWADDHWKVNPELSITYQPDKGRNVWEEEVYEYQSRNPFSKWPSDSSWRDVVRERERERERDFYGLFLALLKSLIFL